MIPHAFVKRHRSTSVESASSSASNKRGGAPGSAAAGAGSSPAASALASMEINDRTSASAHASASSSSSTEPLVSSSSSSSSPARHEEENHDDDATAARAPRQSPPAGQQQLEDVLRETRNKQLRQGDTWFVVDRRWFRRWQAACGDGAGAGYTKDELEQLESERLVGDDDDTAVGPIDNSSIADPQTGKLIKVVQEGVDCVFLPMEAYWLLEAWYGTTGVPTQREVILTKDGPILDLYPPEISLSKVVPAESLSPISSCKTLQCSSGWTIGELKHKVHALLSKDSAASSIELKSRLWHLPGPHPHDTIASNKMAGAEVEAADDDDIIRLSSIRDGEHIAFEQASPDGAWLISDTDSSSREQTTQQQQQQAPPRFGLFSGPGFLDQKEGEQKRRITLQTAPLPLQQGAGFGQSSSMVASTSSAGGTTLRITRSQTGPASEKRGLVGLTNLGNTCFMNSALQCLSNTPSLQHYFFSGYYKNELNPDNPLGMHGEVAKAFGTLIERIWSGTMSTVTPREFKHTLSKFAPAFSGWQQQDSQELIAFLLDGLHEDLNRIKQKPYDEIPDWEGGGDKEEMELANISWELYKRRNDSVIVDLFQGQYRSRLVCPECKKVAIKFDPFMYLSLAIPQTKKWQGDIYVLPADPKAAQKKVTLEIAANANFKKLKQLVGDLTGYDHKKLFACEEWQHKFYKAFTDSDAVGEIGSNDVVIMYELPYELEQPRYRPSRFKTPEDEGKYVVTVVSRRSQNVDRHEKPFGEPFVLGLTAEEASSIEQIQLKICERLSSWNNAGNAVWEGKGKEERKRTKSGGSIRSQKPVISDDEEEGVRHVEDAATTDMHVDAPEANAAGPGDLSGVRKPNLDLLRFMVSSEAGGLHSARPFLMDVSGRRCTLEERYAAVHARHAQNGHNPPHHDNQKQGIIRLPGSFGVDEPDDLYDESPAATDQTTTSYEQMVTDQAENGDLSHSQRGASPAVPPTPMPILRTGEIIEVEWDAEFVSKVFGSELSKSRADGAEAFSTIERIIDPAVQEKRKTNGTKAAKKGVSVEDLLDEFVKEEKLSEDNTWYCPSCKKHQEAQKKFDLWKMPDVLVIHLKRFSNERAFRDKIDTLVDFPIEGLDLSERVEGKKVAHRLIESGPPAKLLQEVDGDESLVYDLFAVDNHFGGLGGGHYTAYAKNIIDEKWYNYDDSRVSPVSNPEDVKTSAAYLLFYRRRSDKPIGGKTHEILASQTASPALSVFGGEDSSDSVTSHGQQIDSAVQHSFRNNAGFIPVGGYPRSSRLGRGGSHASDTENDLDLGSGSDSPPIISQTPPSPVVSDDDDNAVADIRIDTGDDDADGISSGNNDNIVDGQSSNLRSFSPIGMRRFPITSMPATTAAAPLLGRGSSRVPPPSCGAAVGTAASFSPASSTASSSRASSPSTSFSSASASSPSMSYRSPYRNAPSATHPFGPSRRPPPPVIVQESGFHFGLSQASHRQIALRRTVREEEDDDYDSMFDSASRLDVRLSDIGGEGDTAMEMPHFSAGASAAAASISGTTPFDGTTRQDRIFGGRSLPPPPLERLESPNLGQSHNRQGGLYDDNKWEGRRRQGLEGEEESGQMTAVGSPSLSTFTPVGMEHPDPDDDDDDDATSAKIDPADIAAAAARVARCAELAQASAMDEVE